jgi:hypothetical protein
MRTRAPGCSAADVDALLDSGKAIVSWFNRGTLHLVAAEDYGWLHELTISKIRKSVETYLRQNGFSELKTERAVKVIVRTIADGGPSTRAELREALERDGIAVEGHGMVFLIGAAAVQGLIVRGPIRQRGLDGQQEFVLVDDWIDRSFPRGDEVDLEAAEAELARRYLAGHGPASDRDLARWAGVPLGRARRGLEGISGELKDAGTDQDGERLVRLAKAPRSAGTPDPVLLGQFEPVLLGWTSRDAVLDPMLKSKVTVGGVFRPFAMVGGRAVATWKVTRKGTEITPFADISAPDLKALHRDAADVTRYLGWD